ncbi:hypothetical protein B0I37DRAFT_16860 [Chaetomium sp. MPI-CAGE-AT-0009]|nr:hypothetical protein B0I37DRAFT_16860 [Chaetomium sp. MPI-CAGE-AT-0009]
MTATATDLTVGDLSGSPVIFYPVPTPWPSSAGCENYIYRQANGGSILAWDPVYPDRFGVKEVKSCYVPQLSSWWWQTVQPVTAFGPTFVCPEAYSAVHTSVLDSASAAQTQFTYCCPSNYALGAIFQPTQRTVLQCTSEAGPGETISYMTRTSLTRTATVTGVDGTSVETTVQSTNLPTSTVVQSSPATVFAVPVNGFNIVPQQVSGTGATSNTATTPLSTTDALSATDAPAQSSSSGLAPGAIAGAVVGAVIGVGLLALGAFFVWKRKRRAVNRQEVVAGEEDARKDFYHYSPGAPPSEMPVKHNPIHELPHNGSVQELPTY